LRYLPTLNHLNLIEAAAKTADRAWRPTAIKHQTESHSAPAVDDASAAAAICGLHDPLHIAIDVDGFTSAARPAIFAHKCDVAAPKQTQKIKRRTSLFLLILINAAPTGNYFLIPKTPFSRSLAPVSASYLGFMHPMPRTRARYFITDRQVRTALNAKYIPTTQEPHHKPLL
jgi:hypothetical protein